MFQVELSIDANVLVPALYSDEPLRIPVTSQISSLLPTSSSGHIGPLHMLFPLLRCSSSLYLHDLFPHPLHVSNVTFWLRPSLATMLKIKDLCSAFFLLSLLLIPTQYTVFIYLCYLQSVFLHENISFPKARICVHFDACCIFSTKNNV